MEKKEPLVSVLMPSYNSAMYIEEAIASILAQTYQNWELLILDDCSQDDTLALLEQYSDPRIKIIPSDHNQGLSENLNRAKEYVQGDYIARMDSDDRTHPERFRWQVDFLENNLEVDLLGGWVRRFDSHSEETLGVQHDPLTSEAIKGMLFVRPAITHATFMLRSRLYHSQDYWYDKNYTCTEDYELLIRLAQNYTFANLDRVVLDYRFHQSNTSVLQQQEQEKQSSMIRVEYVKFYCSDWSEEDYALWGRFLALGPAEFTSVGLPRLEELLLDFAYAVKRDNACDIQELLDSFLLTRLKDLSRSHLGLGRDLRMSLLRIHRALGLSWLESLYRYGNLLFAQLKGG